jgi:hypothetical protein
VRIADAIARAPLVAGSLIAASCVHPDPSSNAATLRSGTWASSQAVIIVTTQAVHIEFACGSGDIPQVPSLNNRGSFTTDGIMIKAVGPGLVKQAVRYVGAVNGETLTLTVTATDSGENVGTYTVRYNADARPAKCL